MTFEKAVEHVLTFEGGYVFDSNDPGGETNWGISKRSYPHLDIKNLSKQDAIQIYFNDFWTPIKPLLIPDKIRLCLFDCAVNQGVDRAIKILQTAVGTKVDGILGPITLAALKNRNDIDTLIAISQLRLVHYTKLPHWDRYGKGWARRLLTIALESTR